jgi:hypothetical protein
MDDFQVILALSRRLEREGFQVRSLTLDGFRVVPVRADGEPLQPDSSGGYRPSRIANHPSPLRFCVEPSGRQALVATIRPADAEAIRFLRVCNEHGMDPTGWPMWAEDPPAARRWSVVLGGQK